MKKYKYYRITVLMPESVHKQVLELAVKEKRPKSAMAAILIEDGLKMANLTKPVYDHIIMGDKLHEKFIRERKSD